MRRNIRIYRRMSILQMLRTIPCTCLIIFYSMLYFIYIYIYVYISGDLIPSFGPAVPVLQRPLQGQGKRLSIYTYVYSCVLCMYELCAYVIFPTYYTLIHHTYMCIQLTYEYPSKFTRDPAQLDKKVYMHTINA